MFWVVKFFSAWTTLFWYDMIILRGYELFIFILKRISATTLKTNLLSSSSKQKYYFAFKGVYKIVELRKVRREIIVIKNIFILSIITWILLVLWEYSSNHFLRNYIYYRYPVKRILSN